MARATSKDPPLAPAFGSKRNTGPSAPKTACLSSVLTARRRFSTASPSWRQPAMSDQKPCRRSTQKSLGRSSAVDPMRTRTTPTSLRVGRIVCRRGACDGAFPSQAHRAASEKSPRVNRVFGEETAREVESARLRQPMLATLDDAHQTKPAGGVE